MKAIVTLLDPFFLLDCVAIKSVGGRLLEPLEVSARLKIFIEKEHQQNQNKFYWI